MATPEWWLPTVRPEVSQGDLFDDLPFTVCRSPLAPLNYTGFKGGRFGWEETSTPKMKDQKFHALAVLANYRGLLLNHDCDFDKEPSRLLFAPVLPLASIPAELHENILAQRQYSLMPLPDVPGAGMQCADLRTITAVPRELVLAKERIASMTDLGRERLGAQLVAFFLRRELPQISAK